MNINLQFSQKFNPTVFKHTPPPSALFNLTFNHDTGSFSIDDFGWVGGTDRENLTWPDTNKNGEFEAAMKPETLAMIKQYRNLYQPIIERGGYVADKTAAAIQIDPVNLIIPGLIRVADGDIEGVPAGDYPLEKIGVSGVCGDGNLNREALIRNIITLSVSENTRSLMNSAIANIYSLQSLLLPSTFDTGNIGNNFVTLGNSIYDPNTAPDGPVNTGLGTQPIPGVNPPTSPTQSKLLSLYYVSLKDIHSTQNINHVL